MRRLLSAGLLTLTLALLVGCSEQESQVPTEPQYAKNKNKVEYECPSEIDQQQQDLEWTIQTQYENDNAEKGAIENVDNMARNLCIDPPDPAAARATYFEFEIEVNTQPAHKLTDGESGRQLILAKARAFVSGIPYEPNFVIPPEALEDDGGVGVVLPGVPDTIWTNNGEAAFVTEIGTFSGTDPATVAIARLTDPVPGTPDYPIPGYQAFPEAYDFSASVPLDGFAEFWMCVVEPLPEGVELADLVIGHGLGNGESELLTPPLYDFDGTVVDCSNAALQPGAIAVSQAPEWLQLASVVLEPVVSRLFDVKPLNAMYFAGTGLGGRGNSISPFAPVLAPEPYQFGLSCGTTPYGGISWGGGGCSFSLSPGGPISGTSLSPFDALSIVDVTISPASGFQIASVDGCTSGDGTTGSCSVVMDQDRNVTAVFEPIPTTDTYLLTLGGNGAGSGSVAVSYTTQAGAPVSETCTYPLTDAVPCQFTIPGNVEVLLTATEETGVTFDGWGGDCAGAGGDSCYLFMYADRSATATFSGVITAGYTLNLYVGDGGTVTTNRGDSCSAVDPQPCTFVYPSFDATEQLVLTGVPDAGYSDQVSWDANCTVPARSSCALDPQTTMTAYADFALVTSTMSVSLTSIEVGGAPANNAGDGTISDSEGNSCSFAEAGAGTCTWSYTGAPTVMINVQPDLSYGNPVWTTITGATNGTCDATESSVYPVSCTYTPSGSVSATVNVWRTN
jgi:hypothetical protein